MQVAVLEPVGFSNEVRDMLSLHGASLSIYTGTDLSNFLAPAQALFVRLAHKIDAEFLEMAPELRFLCSPTTGLNHIDLRALQSRGIKLLSLRGEREFLETIRATPEHTFGLILALLRKYGNAFSQTAGGGWNRDSCRGEELLGNSVGIIGLGRVGYRVASYCEAFGANVCWYDSADVLSHPSWEKVRDIGSVIYRSRIVVMSADHKAGQAPLIGEVEIKALRGKYFVNTARGELIDEPKFLSAIKSNDFAGVAVDVITNENGDNRLAEWQSLLQGRNVLLTPHIGGATVNSMERTEMFIAQKLIGAMKRGEIP